MIRDSKSSSHESTMISSVQRFVRSSFSFLASLSGAASWSCSADAPQLVEPIPLPSSSADASTAPLAFYPCDITTTLNGVQPKGAECAEVQVPVRRTPSSQRQITLSLKRFRQTTQPRGQLWILAGGPGSAASDFEIDAEFYSALGQDLDLYFLDHRGTGRSTRLTCPIEQRPDSHAGEVIRDEEWATCFESMNSTWGEDLSGFSSEEAATDLGELIAQTREGNEPVFLYAVSYGTYLAQRYLDLFPSQASGVVLDSICVPGQCDLLLEMDRQSNRMGRRIFELCAEDSLCSADLGSTPFARLTALSALLDSAHCRSVGWSSTTLRQVLGMMVTTAGLRDYMPAVVRRLERCNSDDVLALKNFQSYLSGIDTEASSFSQVVHANIVLSELSVRPLPSAEQIERNVSEQYVSMDAGARLASAVSTWRTYAREQSANTLAPTSTPLLMLHGALDPQLPLESAQSLAGFYDLPHQHFVEIPYSPHDTLSQSLLDQTGNTCGTELVKQFLADPLGQLDTSCTSRVLKLNFAGVPAISSLLFGTDAPWNDQR